MSTPESPEVAIPSAEQKRLLWAALTGVAIAMVSATVLRDLQVTASSPRTAGATLSLQGNDDQITNVELVNYFVGAVVGTAGTVQSIGARFKDLNMFNPAIGSGSGGIQFVNYSDGIVDGVSMSGPSSGTQPDFGIQIDNGDTLNFVNTNITRHGAALICETGAGLNAYATMAINCLFDSAGTNSAGAMSSCYLTPAGNIEDTQFTNCWFGLSAGNSGCLLNPTGSGTVNGVDFTGCKFVANAIDGLTANGAGVLNVTVSGGDSADNTDAGLRFSGGATNFTVTGHRAGNTDTRGGNGYGILTSGAGNNYLIVGNNLTGNGTANLSDTATGTNKIVANNLTT